MSYTISHRKNPPLERKPYSGGRKIPSELVKGGDYFAHYFTGMPENAGRKREVAKEIRSKESEKKS